MCLYNCFVNKAGELIYYELNIKIVLRKELPLTFAPPSFQYDILCTTKALNVNNKH